MNIITKHGKGTNQYQVQYPNLRACLALCGIVLSLLFVFVKRVQTETIIWAYISSDDFYPSVAHATTSKNDSTPMTATPIPSPSELEEIVAYITRVFEPEGKAVVKEALEVAFCESKWDKDAYNYNTNHTGDYNLFQINSVHSNRNNGEWKHDWKENVNTAFEIYQEQGWQPWVCAGKLGIK